MLPEVFLVKLLRRQIIRLSIRGSFSAATGVLSLELNATLANTSDWAKTYELAPYSTVEGFECMGMTLANYPVAGALYSTWKANVMEEGVVTEKPEEYVDR